MNKKNRHAGRCFRIFFALLWILSLFSLGGSLRRELDVLAHFQLLWTAIYALALLAFRSWPRVKAAYWRPWLPILLCWIGFVFHGGQMLFLWIPHFSSQDLDRPETLQVAWANVQSGRKDLPRDFRKWLKDQELDLLAMAEVGPAARKSQELQPLLPHVFAPASGGLLLLSRFPILEQEVFEPLPGRIALRVVLQVHRRRLTVFAAHNLGPLEIGHQQYLLQLAKKVSEEKSALLLGDFNTTPWTAVFRSLKGEAELRDGRRGRGIQGSWRPKGWHLPWLPIDHALVRGAAEIRSLEAGPAFQSDHRPLSLTLLLGGSRSHPPDRAPANPETGPAGPPPGP
ncbi:MAG: hypothetical protein DWQ01_13480 [Planctomycetota bacterium]|nr:MAG: hypothetical protein DWQ01_13480 [Planctomycetota bacterium]